MCILKLKLLRLSAGIWCLLQLPVVHTDLFGLADVTVGGVLVIALIHSNFDRRFTPLHSPSVRSRWDPVLTTQYLFYQEVNSPDQERGSIMEMCLPGGKERETCIAAVYKVWDGVDGVGGWTG
ncbi:hypothetical protein ILYODFUR_019717, partial [Ilyodon furcidens]